MRCRDLLLCSVALGLALGIAAAPARAQEARPAPSFPLPALSAAESAAAFAPVGPPPLTRRAAPAPAAPVAAARSDDVVATVAPKPAPPAEPAGKAALPFGPEEIAAAKARMDARIAAAEAEPVKPLAPAPGPAAIVPAPAGPAPAPAAAAPTQDPAPPAAAAAPSTPAPLPVAAPPAQDTSVAPVGFPDAVRAQIAAKLAVPAARSDDRRAAMAKFYTLRDNQPVWIDDGRLTPAGRTLLDRLAQADEDGLDPRAYAVAGLDALAGPSSPPETVANAELAMAGALMAYAHDASSGRVDPQTIGRDIVADAHAPDPVQVLASLAIAADPAGVLDGYNPTHPQYQALKRKLAELRDAEAAVAVARPPLVPPGPTLKVGMSDGRVAVLRSRLGLTMTDGDVYDDALADAVRAFQRERRLKANGVLSPQTLAALNGEIRGSRANAQSDIIANMERWRWMPRDLGSSHVLVNVPEYMVRVTMDGAVVNESRVVVGKPNTPTPIFSDNMQFVVLNPSWYVPQSIIKKEYLPKLANDPNYLVRQGFEVTYRNNQISVRQPPGERNALGHIKFMFPNKFSVYLHDTSSRSLFSSDKRAFSHGCVRVDQPFKFAEIVMGAHNGWTAQKVEKMIGGREQRVDLKQQLPVHIAYFTTFVDDQGDLKRLDDIYGYNSRVLAALGLAK